MDKITTNTCRTCKDIDRKDIDRKDIDRKDIQLQKESSKKRDCEKYCPSVHFVLLNCVEADSTSFHLLPLPSSHCLQEADYSAVYCSCGFDITHCPTLAEKLLFSFC